MSCVESPCQTNTPLKPDNHSLKRTLDTTDASLKDISARSIDERFFQNLFSISQSSNQKIRIKNKVIVPEENDEIIFNNNIDNKGLCVIKSS